jgi:hypothetical protein
MDKNSLFGRKYILAVRDETRASKSLVRVVSSANLSVASRY